jgi:glycerol kinase
VTIDHRQDGPCVLVIDIGTTGVRAAVMRADASLVDVHYRRVPPSTPFPGLVEFDALELSRVAIELATTALVEHGRPVAGVGISTQRASTVVWDATTGEPVGPGLGWQDLRTVGECMVAKATHGLAVAPNQTATKAAWLLNTYDPTGSRDLRVGTVDTWLAWQLTGGAAHVTDRTNAAVTGLTVPSAATWNPVALQAFGVREEMLPTLVATSGIVGPATALPGAPLLAALAGDQQASLIGQGCVHPGDTKITFGTGGMLDMCAGPTAPVTGNRSSHGTFPIVAWATDDEVMWGVEGIMLSAGTNVDWLREDLGLIATSAESHDVASACEHTDGVLYVPALFGLGTPHWDYGARGMLIGLTRGTERRHVVRAVLEGIAHRGADLVDAAEADTGHRIERLRLDGGMSRNPTFVQAVADATGRPVEVAPIADATTMGAGFLAGLATGVWSGFDEIAALWRPAAVVEPSQALDRERWAEAIGRSRRWIPDLSALDF